MRALIPSLVVPVYVIGLATGGAIEAGASFAWLGFAGVISAITVGIVSAALWMAFDNR